MASLLIRMLAGIFGKRVRAPAAAAVTRKLVDEGQLDTILLRNCDSRGGCRAECCSKGVRMIKAEGDRIAQFIAENPQHFAHLKRIPQPLVPLDSLGTAGHVQTEVVTPGGVGRAGLYQALLAGANVTAAENPGSMCVFALPDYRCSLQVAATARGLHKWAYKPTMCWLFPLTSTMIGEKDGCRSYRLDYAGHAQPKHAHYPCSRLEPAGLPASAEFKAEIDYFRKSFIERSDETPKKKSS